MPPSCLSPGLAAVLAGHLQLAGLTEIGRWLQHFEHYWNRRLDALAELLDEEKPS